MDSTATVYPYHSTIPTININLVSKQYKRKCPWVRWICLKNNEGGNQFNIQTEKDISTF